MILTLAGILTIVALLTGQLWLIFFSVILFEIGSGFMGSTFSWFSEFGDDDEQR